MLSTGLRVVSSTLFCLGLFFGVLFVLDKLNIRNLRSRRRRNQEKESENQASEKTGYMKDIRTACGLRHFQSVITIESLTLNMRRMFVGIPGSEGGKGNIEQKQHY